jgi:dUTP pyrophosphatase
MYIDTIYVDLPLELKAIHKDAVVPTKGSKDAACHDLSSVEAKTIGPHSTAVVKTGLKVEYIDSAFKLHIYSRSGLAAKKGVFVLNAPGVIDSDYRGELMVILHNSSDIPFEISVGDRIAQIAAEVAVQSVYRVQAFESNEYLCSSNEERIRGEGGLGSTGVSLEPLTADIQIVTAEGTITPSQTTI